MPSGVQVDQELVNLVTRFREQLGLTVTFISVKESECQTEILSPTGVVIGRVCFRRWGSDPVWRCGEWSGLFPDSSPTEIINRS